MGFKVYQDDENWDSPQFGDIGDTMWSVSIKTGDAQKDIVIDPSQVKELLEESERQQKAAEDDFKEQLVEQALSEAKGFQDMVEDRIPFFSDDFQLTLHKKSLVVVGAPTGNGKSTFCMQSAAHAIANRRKILVISNELPIEAYRNEISRKLATLMGISYDKAFRRVYQFSRIEDAESSQGLSLGWLTLCTYTFKCAQEYNPDLIFVDQLSNAMADIGYTGKGKVEDFKKIETMSQQFGLRINSRKSPKYAPVICFQQMYPPAGRSAFQWDMFSCLRKSKESLTHATHGIMLVKKTNANNETRTWLKIQKVRYPYKYGKDITTWQMNESFVLIPAEDVEEE